MVNRRFGWHSGALKCYDITVENDMTIEGDLTFGDVSTDTITINGIATFTAITNHGTYASPVTIVKGDTNPLITVSGDVLVDQASGVTRGMWVRTKVSKEQSTASVLGIEAQCRVNGAASAAATLGAGQFSGIWAYWEQSGTTELTTGALASAASCTVEGSTDLTVSAGAILAGLVIDSSVNSGASVSAGTFDAIYIKKGSALDWVSGIQFTDCVSSEIFRFENDATICKKDGCTGSKATVTLAAFDGFIKVKIGDQVTYLITVNDPAAS